MTATGRSGARWLLVGASLGLLLGVYTGLGRGGIEHRFAAADLHAVLMVLGFLGTLVGLVQATRLARPWGYLAPVASVLAVPAIVAAPRIGGALLLLAGVVVTASSVVVARAAGAPPLVAIAGVAWVAATVAWLTGAGPIRITPMLAAFLVPTMVAWQLDVGTFRRDRRPGALVVPAVVLVAGAAGAGAGWGPGRLVVGLGLAAFAAWLWVGDEVGRSWRDRGVEGFAARSWLAGRAWLGIAALLWGALGLGTTGPLLHDAAVHALFLGFVTSVTMGHTPRLLAAIGVRCHLGGLAGAALVLLHVSVAARVAADLAGSVTWRGFALHGNTSALLLFVAVVVVASVRTRRERGTA